MINRLIDLIRKKILNWCGYIKSNRKKVYLLQILNFFISIFMLCVHPYVLVTYLICFNFYLKHLKKLTKIQLFFAWVPILIFWYLVLMFGLTMFCPIPIGPGDTEDLILLISFYEPIEPRWCEHICLNTIMILDKLSCFLGYPIVIDFPDIGMFRLFK